MEWHIHSIAQFAPTVDALRKLDAEAQSCFLLRRLATLYPTSLHAFNKGNMRLPQAMDLAYGFPVTEQAAVMDLFFARPWQQLVNNGWILDRRSNGFYSVTAEGFEAAASCFKRQRADLDGVLGARILGELRRSDPSKLHMHNLRAAITEFPHLASQDWLRVVESLYNQGLITCTPLKGASGWDDAANIGLTPTDKRPVTGEGEAKALVAAASILSNEQRQQLAILFTDIIDSSRLNEEFGDLRWGVLRAAHFDAVSSCVTQNISGNQVNLASRVLSQAGGGQIMLTSAVKDAAEDLAAEWSRGLQWYSLGTPALKGFETRSIEIWEVRSASAPESQAAPKVASPGEQRPPRRAQAVVERIKKLLSTSDQIGLHDFLQAETERVRASLMGPKYLEDSSISAENRIAAYDADLERLVPILVCGARWAERDQCDLVASALKRIAEGYDRKGGSAILRRLRKYPATLLFYAMGVLAVGCNRYAFLRYLFDVRISKDDSSAEEPIVIVLGSGLMFEIPTPLLSSQDGTPGASATIQRYQVVKRGYDAFLGRWRSSALFRR